MKTTLTDLFTSKKFLAALTAVLVYVAGRFGFDVDTAVLDRILAALLVYIGAQGIADHGKSAELARAGTYGTFGSLGTVVPPGLESGAVLKTTRDDDIDEVLAWWRGRAAGVVPGPSATTAAGKPSGGTGTPGMLAVLLLGLAGAGSMASCTAAQARQVAAAGAIAALDCEDGHIDAQMLADAKALAAAELQRLIAGAAPADIEGLKAKLRAELAPIKSDAGRCGVAGALAAIAALATSPDPGTATSALVAAGPDPALMRAAFGAAARELGWPAVRLPGGTVL